MAYRLEMDENCSCGMRRRVLMWAALASGSKVLCSYLPDPLERTRSGAGGPPGLAEETPAAGVSGWWERAWLPPGPAFRSLFPSRG